MKLKITTILCIFIGSLNAQKISWTKVLAGENQFNPSMNNSCVTRDSGDGFWVSHLSKEVMSYGQVFLGTIMAKHFNAQGNITDSIVFKGKAHMKYMKNVNGRLYLWLGFFDSISNGTTAYYKPNNYNTWLCYLDKSGVHTIDIMDDTIAALTVLNNGDVAMVTSGGFGSTLALHIFTPPVGTHTVKSLSNLGYVRNIEQATDGGLLISGGCMGSTVVMDDVNISNPFAYTNYVVYLDAQRTARWLRFIEDVTCVSSAAIGSGKDAYWAGNTYTPPAFDSLVYKGGPVSSFEDFFVTRIRNKKYQWVKEIPEDTTIAGITTGETHSLGMDAENNVYMLGTVHGRTIHWDANTITGKAANSYNIILASWDSSGNLRWVRDFGGAALELGMELTVKGVDELLFSAVVTDTFDLEGKTVNANYGDILVVKMDPITSGLEPVPTFETMRLFPNPAGKNVNHNLQVPTPFELYTISGKRVKQGVLVPGESVDIQTLTNGVYFFRTTAGNARLVKLD